MCPARGWPLPHALAPATLLCRKRGKDQRQSSGCLLSRLLSRLLGLLSRYHASAITASAITQRQISGCLLSRLGVCYHVLSRLCYHDHAAQPGAWQGSAAKFTANFNHGYHVLSPKTQQFTSIPRTGLQGAITRNPLA